MSVYLGGDIYPNVQLVCIVCSLVNHKILDDVAVAIWNNGNKLVMCYRKSLAVDTNVARYPASSVAT